jgi:hypothetical protein
VRHCHVIVSRSSVPRDLREIAATRRDSGHDRHAGARRVRRMHSATIADASGHPFRSRQVSARAGAGIPGDRSASTRAT